MMFKTQIIGDGVIWGMILVAALNVPYLSVAGLAGLVIIAVASGAAAGLMLFSEEFRLRSFLRRKEQGPTPPFMKSWQVVTTILEAFVLTGIGHSAVAMVYLLGCGLLLFAVDDLENVLEKDL